MGPDAASGGRHVMGIGPHCYSSSSYSHLHAAYSCRCDGVRAAYRHPITSSTNYITSNCELFHYLRTNTFRRFYYFAWPWVSRRQALALTDVTRHFIQTKRMIRILLMRKDCPLDMITFCNILHFDMTTLYSATKFNRTWIIIKISLSSEWTGYKFNRDILWWLAEWWEGPKMYITYYA